MKERLRLAEVRVIIAIGLLVIGSSAHGQSIQTEDNIETGAQLVSTVATGTPPLLVTSTTKVTGLNADQLDGLDASGFASGAEVAALNQAITELQNTLECIRPRWYYLTKGFYKGAEATSACESGFHMASMYELTDLSDDYYALLPSSIALWHSDQGWGPPSTEYGWVRTGAGIHDTWNCRAYTSSSSAYGGFTMALGFSEYLENFSASCATTPNFDEPNWDPRWGESCAVARRVWCITDPPPYLQCGP